MPDNEISLKSLPVYSYKIVATYPHNPESFTQGFAYDNGFLYEGTGLYGHSRLLCYSLNGDDVKSTYLPSHLFGEGITVFGDRVVQLTWKAGIGIVWDKKSLQMKRLFSYRSDGWGLTHDDQWLIMSDGSSTLAFLNPTTFTFHHRITVTDNNGPVLLINELEYIKGEIWANIWKDDQIIRINPLTGKVLGRIDLSALTKASSPGGGEDVLNGIAYDRKNDRIFITGKRWDKLFQIKIIEREK
ncbi:MAG: glutaminyl-peptide cyclotransferase [Desulfobulbaceae bacterium]|uniref:Glutaminyl-peptide cyclotransferase n=1 Tax=Candidatus Desulfobia pelagia TaxID=2841692 RepID=A0A8J6TBZ6_9BACT|nr:glutaminyl-peptide cyclotransferase [Candidatus Desulfobia pelagia]